MAPFHSFGAFKFIPELSKEKFKQILLSNPLNKDETADGELYRKVLKNLYPKIEDQIFSLSKP
jgi:hypothetical protein